MTNNKPFNIVLLRYKEWEIQKDTYNYILHHVDDVKCRNDKYPSSLAYALKLLHEKIFIEGVRDDDSYAADFESLRNHILETDKKFEALMKNTRIA